jgi:putative CocE/NonD family hydrolase
MPVEKPHHNDIVVHDTVWIPLRNGLRLAARIWLPANAERAPVPAILEYTPYRRRDATTGRDERVHAYFASRGYASVRVDIRGSGDSDGVLLGEYLPEEQQDAVEIIAWLAGQPWCSGSVGMIGFSWGGFNGLQVAALRPPQLKAVISLCSTDDRYADDVHMMGGCLLTDKLAWGAAMLARGNTPPDPAVVGDSWRDMWLERLEYSGLWLAEWHRHLRRDAFYKHGSVCEDYDAIEAPVYLVGGWADGYSNAIFRMLANLKCPRKGLVGPWGHDFPNFALPGPRIGFLQECLRWWDKWLKGHENGIMKEPVLRAWIQDSVLPASRHEERPGHWVAEAAWPPPLAETKRFYLTPLGLSDKNEGAARFLISSPQTVGAASGTWCPYGHEPDLPSDQREEAGGSLVFDSEPLKQPIVILGAPELKLAFMSDRPQAQVAVVLSEVMPDGSATRISYGLLNLSRRDSHERPEALTPGKEYLTVVRLNEAGHRFDAGNRIRLAISTAYWPVAWPSPEVVSLGIAGSRCEFRLPVRKPRSEDLQLAAFPAAEAAEPSPRTTIASPASRWTLTRDLNTGMQRFERITDAGTHRLDRIDLQFGSRSESIYSIHPNQPTSARIDISSNWHFARGQWAVRTETKVSMRASIDVFRIDASLKAYEGADCIFTRDWSEEIPRDHV